MNKTLEKNLLEQFVELIRVTSTELPDDVYSAIEAGKKNEAKASSAEYAMGIICDNVSIAKKKSQPLCQDTGTVVFYLHYPARVNHAKLCQLVKKAVVLATKKGYLRQNSVDSITGKNSGNNIGPGAPVIHAEPWEKDTFDFRLMLKGGGCENVGAQYSLPDSRVGASRDLLGVKKCILDAIQNAQGKGCGPGILGVCIGGDRSTGYEASKQQFLRKLGDQNKDPILRQMEEEMTKTANELGIGPMGFGGKTTLLGTKITALNRVPASFFVSVSYMCWAFRRQGMVLDQKGKMKKWLY